MQDAQGVSHLEEVMARISGWLREKLASEPAAGPNQAMQRTAGGSMTNNRNQTAPLGLESF
jgi:hypothetical protein